MLEDTGRGVGMNKITVDFLHFALFLILEDYSVEKL
jgi:hypothetical protein